MGSFVKSVISEEIVNKRLVVPSQSVAKSSDQTPQTGSHVEAYLNRSQEHNNQPTQPR